MPRLVSVAVAALLALLVAVAVAVALATSNAVALETLVDGRRELKHPLYGRGPLSGAFRACCNAGKQTPYAAACRANATNGAKTQLWNDVKAPCDRFTPRGKPAYAKALAICRKWRTGMCLPRRTG